MLSTWMKPYAKKKNDNILQQNLFIILSSVEMTAVTRFFAILHLAICMPFRWLTGKTHQLGHRNWGARSMGRAIDIIHTACKDIIEDTGLIHDESFMMHIFDQLRQELPEFDEYLDYMFETKSLDNVQSNAEQKQVINKRLIKELFTPSDRDNQDSNKMLKQLLLLAFKLSLTS